MLSHTLNTAKTKCARIGCVLEALTTPTLDYDGLSHSLNGYSKATNGFDLVQAGGIGVVLQRETVENRLVGAVVSFHVAGEVTAADDVTGHSVFNQSSTDAGDVGRFGAIVQAANDVGFGLLAALRKGVEFDVHAG